MAYNIFLNQTSANRSAEVTVKSGQHLTVNIQGTATIQLISNPFGSDTLNDVVFQTISISGVYEITSDNEIFVNISAVSGSVSISSSGESN